MANCNSLIQHSRSSSAETIGEKPEARSYHGCALANKFMFVIGGINHKAQYLDSTYYLNLENLKWTKFEIQNFFNQGVAFIKAFSGFSSPIKLENLLIQYEYLEPVKKARKFQEEGIFIYGGKLENGQYLDDLHCIKIGTNPISLKKV